MSRVTVFSKDGYFITDIRVSTVCSWTLPRTKVIGRCNFDLSTLDPKTQNRILNYGNYVLVRHPKLPDWLGVIYPSRNYGYKKMSIVAYQVEKVLEWRNTPTQIINGSAGSLFYQILRFTNSAKNNEKPIIPNNIYYGEGLYDETLGSDALSHIQNIALNSGNDFEITYSFTEEGRLTLLGNWYKSAGMETNLYLREGKNLELTNNIMEEKGELFNRYVGFSEAYTDGARLSYVAEDETAQSKFGLYETTKVFQLKENGSLGNSVMVSLAQTLDTQKVFDITALDVNTTFNNLRIGSYWTIDAADKIEITPIVQIMGMEHDDLEDGKCRIITEVVANG